MTWDIIATVLLGGFFMLAMDRMSIYIEVRRHRETPEFVLVASMVMAALMTLALTVATWRIWT